MLSARRRVLAAIGPFVLLLLTVAVAPPAAVAETGSGVSPRGSEYVALGDSYSSGEGLEGYDQTADGSDNSCHRSSSAYSAYAYRQSLFKTAALSFRFVACSGSVTRDLFNPNHANPDEKPQLEALGASTGLVTLTIGGNDLGFADVLADCVYVEKSYTGGQIGSPGCSKRQSARVKTRLDHFSGAADDPISTNYPISEVLSSIRSRSPKAEVYVAGYPRVFGSAFVEQDLTRQACQVGAVYRYGNAGEGKLFVEKSDALWINKQVDAINKVVREQAQNQGMTYVDPNQDAGFKGHGLCDTDASFVESAHINDDDSPQPQSFHPTIAGQRAYAEVFRRRINATYPPQIETPVSHWELPQGEQIEMQLRTLDHRKGTWALASGKLPPGVMLSATGLLAGRSTADGSFAGRVRFTDLAGRFDDVGIDFEVGGDAVEVPSLDTYLSSTGVYPLSNLACRSSSRCVAFGWGDFDRHTLSRLTTQGWSAAVTSHAAGLLTDYGSATDGLACTATGRCYLALYDDGVWTTSDDGVRWTKLAAGVGSSLRCDGATEVCSVPSDRGAVLRVSAAGLSPLAPAPGPNPSHLSCASLTACVATSYDGDLMAWNGSAWSIEAHAYAQWETLACASPTFCVAGNRDGGFTRWNGVRWSALNQLPEPDYITAIDCTGARCFLTTSDHVYRVSATGSARDLALPPLVAVVPVENVGVVAISCPAENACRVADGQGDVWRWSGSTWAGDPAVNQFRLPTRTPGDEGPLRVLGGR